MNKRRIIINTCDSEETSSSTPLPGIPFYMGQLMRKEKPRKRAKGESLRPRDGMKRHTNQWDPMIGLGCWGG